MLAIHQFEQIYIYRPFIDFRIGIFGLSSFVQEKMNLNPFEKYLFLFSNRQRNRIKALYWDQTGFALWFKCLEREKYKWPFHLTEDHIVVNRENLEFFLLGLDPWQTPHKKLHFNSV
jgi:transposase